MTRSDAAATRDHELRTEARHLHAALSSGPLPAAIEDAYVAAHQYCCPPEADRIDLSAIVARGLDVEALELVLRRRHPVLTRKLRILVYLTEATPSGYSRLVNRSAQPVRAWLTLAAAGIRTLYKYAKGTLLLRRHRIG